jgi:hypothetical protein
LCSAPFQSLPLSTSATPSTPPIPPAPLIATSLPSSSLP